MENIVILRTRDQIILQLLALHDAKDVQIAELQQRVTELEKAMADSIKRTGDAA